MCALYRRFVFGFAQFAALLSVGVGKSQFFGLEQNVAKLDEFEKLKQWSMFIPIRALL